MPASLSSSGSKLRVPDNVKAMTTRCLGCRNRQGTPNPARLWRWGSRPDSRRSSGIKERRETVLLEEGVTYKGK